MGFATVCSATINGVLLKAGIPMDSRFGGILEMRDSQPRRFVAIIHYAGSSLDPSLAYIKARHDQRPRGRHHRQRQDPRQLPRDTGGGQADGAGADREPESHGIGGVVIVGYTSQPVCQIPVGLNKVGVILDGGLNPLAAAEEAGIEAENIANSGTLDFTTSRQLLGYLARRHRDPPANERSE